MGNSENMVKMTPEKELKILFPEREFKSSLGEISVSPFKFGQFPKVLEVVNKYSDVFSNGGDLVSGLMAKGTEALNDLALLFFFCTVKDRDWLDQMSGDEALDLIFKVFEVNADFFIQKVKMGSLKIVETIQKASQSKSAD